MKRLGVLSLVASAVFFASSFAVAQDDYLPLVQEETVSIVRVDLSKIDGQSISKQFQKLATGAIDAFVQDKEQADQAKQAVPLLGVMIAQNVATYVKPLQEAGVKNAYFVIEQPKADETLYPYLAISTKDFSKEQVEKIRNSLKELNKALNSAIKYRFERNGFMIVLLIPDTVEANDAKEYAKNRFLKFNTVEKPEFAEGFKLVDSNAVVAGVTLNARNEEMIQKQLDSVAQILDQAQEDEALANQMKDSINKFNELGKKASEYVSFQVSSLNLDELNSVNIIKAKSADDAQKYVALLKGEVKEEFSKMCAAILESKSVSATSFAEDAKEMEGLLDELYDVFTQCETNDSVVSWKFDEQFCNNSKPTFDKVIAFAKKVVEKAQAASAEADDEDAEESATEE